MFTLEALLNQIILGITLNTRISKIGNHVESRFEIEDQLNTYKSPTKFLLKIGQFIERA